MITSALPSTAKFKNLSSFWSRHSAMAELASIISPLVAFNSSTATTSSLAISISNFGLLRTSSSSAKVAKEIKGWHLLNPDNAIDQ
jgi:hypothetical protein